MVLYNFAQHHHKYFRAMSHAIFSDQIVAKKSNWGFFNGSTLTNSYFGYRTLEKMHKKNGLLVITMGHSMFPSKEQIKKCTPTEPWEYFLAPAYWGVTGENIITYPGHYMNFHHYQNKYNTRVICPEDRGENNNVLYLPISGIKKLDEVRKALENIPAKYGILIKPHPISYDLSKTAKNWDEASLGIKITDYIKLEKERKNLFVIRSETTGIEKLVDYCKYIVATPPTSTMVEALVRGRIYNSEKLVVSTNDLDGIPSKLGIPVCASPCIKDFTPTRPAFIDKVLTSEKSLGEGILSSIKEINKEALYGQDCK